MKDDSWQMIDFSGFIFHLSPRIYHLFRRNFSKLTGLDHINQNKFIFKET